MTDIRSRRALLLMFVLAGAFALIASMLPMASARAGGEPDAAVTLQGDVAELNAAEVDLLDSDIPKTVVVDAETGDITSVTAVKDDGQLSTMGMAYGCKTGQTCWYGYKALYTNYSFTGSGAAGNWLYRGVFASGSRTAAACYVSSGNKICHRRVGPNTQVNFENTLGGKGVTGREVILY